MDGYSYFGSVGVRHMITSSGGLRHVVALAGHCGPEAAVFSKRIDRPCSNPILPILYLGVTLIVAITRSKTYRHLCSSSSSSSNRIRRTQLSSKFFVRYLLSRWQTSLLSCTHQTILSVLGLKIHRPDSAHDPVPKRILVSPEGHLEPSTRA